MAKSTRGFSVGYIRASAQTIHFGLAILIIFALAYLLGRALLMDPVGNDAPLHLSYASWLSQYFPKIPNWYSLHGGGMSIARAYPLMGHYLLALIENVIGLSILQAYHLVTFIAVPAAALGIYLLCWSALRNQTVGLIAACFYLLTPMAWVWTHEHGYLAQAVGTVFVPLTFLCLDRYLSLEIVGGNAIAKRMWFAGFVLFAVLGTLGHMISGGTIALMMVLYVVLMGLLVRTEKRWDTLKKLIRGFLFSGLTVTLLVAFWIVPILTYNRVASLGGLHAPPPDQLNQPYLLEILSLTPPGEIHWIADASFPLVVVALAAIGLLLSGFYSRKALVFSIIAWFAVLAAGTTEVRALAASLWEWLQIIIGERSFMLLAQILIPVSAAYGAMALARTLLRPLNLFKREFKQETPSQRLATNSPWLLGASSLALIIALTSAYLLRNVSSSREDLINYGLSRRGFPVSDIWGVGGQERDLAEQLAPSNWPSFEFLDEDPAIEAVKKLAAMLPEKDWLRIDLSPFLGRYAQNIVSLKNVSQINTYNWNANLNLGIWGYQVNVFFSDDPPGQEFGTAKTLNELSSWYGIEYVFVRTDEDPTLIYQTADWEQVEQDGNLELWKYPNAAELATLSSKPTVLVISRNDLRLYELVFRAANRGAMPYDEFQLVQGREDVDSYTLDELSRFDALFLNGYSYKDSAQAWALLEQYVMQGGGLYIDTGWQWTVPEWEFVQAPSVLPVSSLKWTNYGMNIDYQLGHSDIVEETDTNSLAPLVWENGPWSISGANSEDIREWGELVLAAAGRPLIVAGDYGDGRVVWSGMNLVAHAIDNENDAETRLIHDLVSWLTGETTSQEYPVAATREYPDQVKFSLDLPTGSPAWLYWREAYHPAWHAYIVAGDGRRSELPIDRAGPGFMLMEIDDEMAAESIELIWKTPLVERVAAGVSIATVLGLSALVLDAVLMGGRWFSKLGTRLGKLRAKPEKRGSVAWLPDSFNADNVSDRA